MAYGCLGIRLTCVMCLMLDIKLTLYQNFIYMVSYNRENSFQSYIIQHQGHGFHISYYCNKQDPRVLVPRVLDFVNVS
jgi:hypothetical protein